MNPRHTSLPVKTSTHHTHALRAEFFFALRW
jgi:hypothetical protein